MKRWFARDLAEGERRLSEAIFSLNGTTTGAAGTIMERVLGPNQATDDIAILTATIHSLPERARRNARLEIRIERRANRRRYVGEPTP